LLCCAFSPGDEVHGLERALQSGHIESSLLGLHGFDARIDQLRDERLVSIGGAPGLRSMISMRESSPTRCGGATRLHRAKTSAEALIQLGEHDVGHTAGSALRAACVR